MMNVFPVMYLAMLAYAVLRIALGGLFVYLGLQHALTASRQSFQESFESSTIGLLNLGVFITVEVVAGGMLVAGFLTQIAAIALLAISCYAFVMNKKLKEVIPDRFFYLLAIAAFICLFITGAGAFAFDIPL